MTYEEFLKTKELERIEAGFDVTKRQLNKALFPFQKDIVAWALKKGKAAIFSDCGTGKTIMQLEFANQVCKHSKGNALVIAPLAVVEQTKKEGAKFGIMVNVCRSESDVKKGINPVSEWQNVASPMWEFDASPFWWDINQSNTLNVQAARDGRDERHICPLQLDVIDRLLKLYTNPNDIVFTPFMGIGSEVYQSVLNGRRGIGIELKPTYYKCAVDNLQMAEKTNKQMDLFEFIT